MASKLYIKVITDLSQTQLDSLIKPAGERYEQSQELINLLHGAMNGAKALTLEIESSSEAASGTITPSGVQANDTITIEGVTLTAKEAADAEDEFQIGLTDLLTARNLRDAINANSDLQQIVEAELDEAIVVVKCAFPGPLGDAITLASSSSPRLAVSDSTLDNGTQGTTRRNDFNRDS